MKTFDGMMALSRELGMLPTWGVANGPEDYRDGQPVFEHLVVFTDLPPGAVRRPGRPQGDVPSRSRGPPAAARRPGSNDVHGAPGAVIDPRELYLKFRELGSLLTAIGDAEGPVIAMGDFNAMTPARPGTTVQAQWGRASRRTIWPPFEEASSAPSSTQGSWILPGCATHSTGGSESTLIGRDGRRLDHILVSSSLGPCIAGSYILDNEMARVASDHLPVVTELDFGVLEDLAQDAQAEAVPLSGGDVAVWGRPNNR